VPKVAAPVCESIGSPRRSGQGWSHSFMGRATTGVVQDQPTLSSTTTDARPIDGPGLPQSRRGGRSHSRRVRHRQGGTRRPASPSRSNQAGTGPDRQINIATFNPDWEGFAKGSSPLPDVQLEIITQHRRKFANVPLREPVQEPASVQEYHARGRLLGAGSERNTTPVDGRHTTPVDGRQKTTIVVGGSKEPLPKEAVPVELEKPTNGGCAEQSQQDRYQQLIRLCRGRVIVGRVLRLIRARIARGFAAAKPGSGGRIEYNPPPTPLIADAK
jgi:hypothetical protein